MTITMYAIIETSQPYEPYLSQDFGYTECVAEAMLWKNKLSAELSCSDTERVVTVNITYEVTV